MPSYLKFNDFAVFGEVDVNYLFPEFAEEEEIVNPSEQGKGFYKTPYVPTEELSDSLDSCNDILSRISLQEQHHEELLPDKVAVPKKAYWYSLPQARKRIKRNLKAKKYDIFRISRHGKGGRHLNFAAC